MDVRILQKMIAADDAASAAAMIGREAAVAELLAILVDNSAKGMRVAADSLRSDWIKVGNRDSLHRSETAAEDAATLRRAAEIYREQAALLRAMLEEPDAALDRARDVVAQHRRAGLTVVRDDELAGEGDPGAGTRVIGSGLKEGA